MGAIISGPLSVLGTCLGSLCGGCLAAGCGKLAGSGNVSTDQAARCVLLWLQAFTALLAVVASSTAQSWLPTACDKIGDIGLGDVGVCQCDRADAAPNCWADQLVYRAEASGIAVFLVLLILSISGCAEGASRSHSVAKFMVVVLLGIVSLFLPNQLFSDLGTIAASASAVFLVAQAILLIDFAYTWNELWYGNAIEAHRRQVSRGGYKGWIAAVLGSSALFFVGAVALCVYMYTATTDPAGHAINLTAMGVAFLLLVVSILDWCEHGNLLTSAVMMAYTMWLVLEALAVIPSGQTVRSPQWVGLTVCCVSLLAFARGAGGFSKRGAAAAGGEATRQEAAVAPTGAGTGLVAAESGATAAPPPASRDVEAGASEGDAHGVDAKGFAIQCLVHAAAALYITSSMAPRAGGFVFAAHVAAVFVSLALYGWSLVAPKLLSNRDFR